MADVAFHSSGTTGAAKEIVRTEESLLADARCLIETFPEIWGTDPKVMGTKVMGTDPKVMGTDPEKSPLVIASVLPDHMYGALWRVRVPALSGVAVDPKTILSVEEIALSAVKSRSLIFVTTPSFLEKAIQHPEFCKLYGFFRAIITSGGPLRRETALAVRKLVGVCPLEIYGSTEAGTVAWRRLCDGEAFVPVSGVTVAVQAQGTDPVFLGTDPREGVLVVDSPFAMKRPLAMGDRAAMVDGRRFILKGRADRRVKILERYVSLAEVESSLAAHPFVSRVRVEAYGDAVPRLGALIVLKDDGLAAVVQNGREAVAALMRAFLKGKLEDVAIPRRFRFVRELPANAQGKTTAEAVRSALCAWCREPIVTAWRATAGALEAKLVFTHEMECFKGHFPGFPILPGVAQLCFLRHFARQAFADWPETATFRKLKFQKIIRPGAPVTMRIERCGEDAFAFELSIESGRCTSGSVGVSVPSCACPHAQPDDTKERVMRAPGGRRTTGFIAAALSVLSILCASASPRDATGTQATLCASASPREISRPTAALQKALVSSANWTMERRIGEKGRLLRSSGTVDCVAKSGIVWRVAAPFESSVAMTTNAMVFADEEGVRVKPLAELPHYAEIREKTDAFVAGDAKAFDGLFEIDATASFDGGWRLVMKPEVAAMREHLFSEIELTGAELPTNAVLKTPDGGFCTIRFSASGK